MAKRRKEDSIHSKDFEKAVERVVDKRIKWAVKRFKRAFG